MTRRTGSLAAVVSLAPGVAVLEAEAFVNAAAAAGLGAVCERDGALELF